MYLKQMMRETMKRDLKAVIFLGDMGPHFTNIDARTGASEEEELVLYRHMKDFFYNLAKKYFSKFKNKDGDRIPMYMNFGNHDALWNYQQPNTKTGLESDYYNFLNNLYMEGDQSLAMGKYDKDRSLYKEIGSYVATDILNFKGQGDYISILSLNSLYFALNNKNTDYASAEFILRWVEDVLKNSPKEEKFILTMHIFPGTSEETWTTKAWREEFQVEFKRILEKYTDKFIVSIAGHLHTFRMMLPLYSKNEQNKQLIHFNLGAFSPIFSNNMLYYIFKFSNNNGKVTLNDILAEEIDLHGLITTERSLANDILADITPISSSDISTEDWVKYIHAGIDLFLHPEITGASVWVLKYLLFMIGFSDLKNKNIIEPFSNRFKFSLNDVYKDMSYNKAVY
mmetsp:Transcript_793/g.661  ORF Transcript_793/g.661 Transcript_793/m.661 type:complete len:397 (+) Transcript_793:248-1438(+)